MSKLLVVDDDLSILLAFRRAFRSTAVEVLTAELAGEGIELARKHRPDVIFSTFTCRTSRIRLASAPL